MSRRAQNSLVLVAAALAGLGVIKTQTNWLSADIANDTRERCYGVPVAAANDCMLDSHACVAAKKSARDASDWIILPQGKCAEIGGRAEAL